MFLIFSNAFYENTCIPSDCESVKTIIYFNSVYIKDGWLHTIITILYYSYLGAWNFLYQL